MTSGQIPPRPLPPTDIQQFRPNNLGDLEDGANFMKAIIASLCLLGAFVIMIIAVLKWAMP